MNKAYEFKKPQVREFYPGNDFGADTEAEVMAEEQLVTVNDLAMELGVKRFNVHYYAHALGFGSKSRFTKFEADTIRTLRKLYLYGFSLKGGIEHIHHADKILAIQ